MKKIAIIDYGSGNQMSLINIFKHLNIDAVLTKNKNKIKDSSHIFIPGVGAYNILVEKFKNLNCFGTIEAEMKNGKPIMGVCVGMQIFSDFGEENVKTKGLGWIPGHVSKLKCKKKRLPHVGWNNINILNKDKIFNNFEGIPDYYFVHSYGFISKNKKNILATASYDQNNDITAIVKKNNVIGVQFHPEKSQLYGKLFIKNFINYY